MRQYRMQVKFTILLLMIYVIWTFAGCSNNEDLPSGISVEDSVSSLDSTYYPVTVVNYNRSRNPIEITFTKRPERVVAVYQSSVETLLALGVSETVIAAVDLDHPVKPQYQSDFERLHYYNRGISKETVMGLGPDLIVSWYSFFGDTYMGDVKFWHDRGINTYMMTNSGAVIGAQSLEQEYQDIRNLGIIFNVQDTAEAIISDIQSELAKGRVFAEGHEPISTVVIESGSDGLFRVYGEDSVGGDMAIQLGADLVAKKSGVIGAEDLVALNPDVIFSVYYSHYGEAVNESDALSRILKNPGLASMSAIQNERVYLIQLGEIHSSGIRTIDGVQTMLKGLYPNEYAK